MKAALILSAMVAIGVASYLVFAPLYIVAFTIECVVRLFHHIFLIIPATIIEAAKASNRRSSNV